LTANWKSYFTDFFMAIPPQFRERAINAHVNVPSGGLSFPICSIPIKDDDEKKMVEIIVAVINSRLKMTTSNGEISGVITWNESVETCSRLFTVLSGAGVNENVKAAVNYAFLLNGGFKDRVTNTDCLLAPLMCLSHFDRKGS
ncbi:hypothetical protein PMAYCL1PPCAC_10520, partial [Pristionchus mayeri]